MPNVAAAPADAIGPQHRNVPRFLRLLAASLLAGGVVGLLMWLGDTRARLAPGVLIAAYVAGWIYLASDLLLTILERPLNRLEGLSRGLAIAGLFFGAGALGWQLAALTLPWITGGGWRLAALDWRFALGFAGGVGAFFGLLIFGYERLRDRLAESVVRLKEKEFADQELRTARDIQQRLLPPPAVEGPGYRVAARNLAAQVVAGDFYDVFPLDGEALGLAVGDVAGKGMGAGDAAPAGPAPGCRLSGRGRPACPGRRAAAVLGRAAGGSDDERRAARVRGIRGSAGRPDRPGGGRHRRSVRPPRGACPPAPRGRLDGALARALRLSSEAVTLRSTPGTFRR